MSNKFITYEGRPKSSRYAIQQGRKIKLIKSISFGFENMEWYDVPIECFESLSINSLDDDRCEIECHVIDNGEIEADSYGAEYTFAQRVDKYNDIDCIRLDFENDDYLALKPVWHFSDDHWNSESTYQKSIFNSYKDIEISIAKKNKTYTLEEALKSEDGAFFRDEVGHEYLVWKNKLMSKGEGGVLIGASVKRIPLTLEILQTKFTKVD